MKHRFLALLLSAFVAAATFGLSACGTAVEISSAEINADGELIITYTDGTTSNLGVVDNSVDVKDAYMDENGDLIIELTNGKKFNAGKVTLVPEFPEGNLYIGEVKENGEVTGYEIKGVDGAANKNLVIPSEYNQKPVVAISDRAFAGCEEIESIKIPDSVRTVGESAFSDCVNLKDVSFGKGIIEIGRAAFARCEKLENVNVADIGAWCNINFAGMSASPMYFAHNLYVNNVLVSEITLPDTVTSIGAFAFYECGNIVSINTGNGVKSIGRQAFFNCPALESLITGSGLETIGELAFSDCEKLKTLEFGENLKVVGDYAFQNCGAVTEVTIPSSVEAIGECAFTSCGALTDLTMNYGLQTIGRGAFAGCSSLLNFIMPDSVTSIGWGMLMFGGGGAGFGGIVDGTNNIGSIKISSALTVITDHAFSGCFMKSITIGENVQTIEYSAFYGCAELETVIIPKSVKRIVSYAFYQCPLLQTVFYEGTSAEWRAISVGRNGNEFHSSDTVRDFGKVYYYSETQPAGEGNFWHYADGEPVKW